MRAAPWRAVHASSSGTAAARSSASGVSARARCADPSLGEVIRGRSERERGLRGALAFPERGEPGPEDRRPALARVLRRERPQQPPRAPGVAGRDRVADGVGGLAVAVVPVGRARVQRRLEVALGARELGAERGGQ
jgi:hypothetical protein